MSTATLHMALAFVNCAACDMSYMRETAGGTACES